jgi:hypothetical protein
MRVLDEGIKEGVKREFPQVIVFDWNGTVDARGTGIGIPAEVLFALKALGKTVIIFTSSIQADRKLFMRKWAEEHGIPFTDNMKILKNADMLVGDKHSDERHAGKYGVNFVYTKDFAMEKVLPKIPRRKIVTHPQNQVCTCDVNHLGKRHNAQSCSCVVDHPKEGEFASREA